MNVFRTTLEGRGSYTRQKTRLVAPRRGEEPIQRVRPVRLNPTHYRDPTSNKVGSSKGEGRGSHKSARNDVRVWNN